MLYFIQLLLVLIKIDQEIILNWFGIQNTAQNINLTSFNDLSGNSEFINNINLTFSNVSLDTVRLILVGCWSKINYGLSLADIEGAVFFILFIRFIILGIRYNLKTSFYITSIGLVAGYLWYRHLIDLIAMYRNTLLNIPFLENLGLDALRLREYHYQVAVNNKTLGDNIHWYNIGQLMYFAILKSIVNIDPDTGLKFYIDPLSMVVSNLDDSTQTTIFPLYYKVYNQILPRIFSTCSKFWQQLSGIAAYGLITRIGKRYCPYLVRWHWTFLLIVSIFEPFIEYFVFRAEFFEEFILTPQLVLASSKSDGEEVNRAIQLLSMYNKELPDLTSNVSNEILFQITSLNMFISSIIIIHVSLIILALFHAIWGQYFYFPFLTENVELHIGPRPKNSLYSGGNTSWQESSEKKQNLDRLFPKLWYGWFGRGTKKKNGVLTFLKDYVKKWFR